MSQGAKYSAILHVVIILLVIFGLPTLTKKTTTVSAPIPIEIENVSDKTRSLKRTKTVAKPDIKPTKKLAVHSPKKEKPKPKPITEAVTLPKAAKPEKAKPVQKPAVKPKTDILQKVEAPQAKPKVEKVKKKPEQDFDSVLKNLQKLKKESDEKGAKKQEDKSSFTLGDKLSISEIDLIRKQIAPCWNIPAGAQEAENLVVEVRVHVNPDGRVRDAQILDSRGSTRNPYYRVAAESAKRAVLNPQCNPLKLPAHKYEQWKVMVLHFDPNEML